MRLVPADTDQHGGRPVRVRHAARHARTSEPRPRPRNPTASLSIRSAERRRWAAELRGPGRGGLVIYGMGGIGKSTLAAQIAECEAAGLLTVVPGARAGLPLRTARLAAPGGAAHRMLAFFRAQRSPYQPGYAGTAGSVVTVEFAAPAPPGLLDSH